jgi:hypothetical protein
MIGQLVDTHNIQTLYNFCEIEKVIGKIKKKIWDHNDFLK